MVPGVDLHDREEERSQYRARELAFCRGNDVIGNARLHQSRRTDSATAIAARSRSL